MAQDKKKSIARNKKAYADFEILERLEAGIMLTGNEIKSIRQGKINLKGSYIDIRNEEAFTEGMHISSYQYGRDPQYEPTRKRKLLLHKKEINKLIGSFNAKGYTIIPLEVYLKRGIAKVLIGLCKGKKKYDRRQELRKKTQEMEIKHALKRY